MSLTHEPTQRLLPPPPLFVSATLKQSLRRPREQTCQGIRLIHEKNPSPLTKATETMLCVRLGMRHWVQTRSHGALLGTRFSPEQGWRAIAYTYVNYLGTLPRLRTFRTSIPGRYMYVHVITSRYTHTHPHEYTHSLMSMLHNKHTISILGYNIYTCIQYPLYT